MEKNLERIYLDTYRYILFRFFSIRYIMENIYNITESLCYTPETNTTL